MNDWKRGIPAADGWYFWRASAQDNEPEPCGVLNGGKTLLVMRTPARHRKSFEDQYPEAEFCGPIPIMWGPE